MKPYTIKNREGESISPMTSTKTVFYEKGVDLDTLLSQQRQDADNVLKDYAKKTEVAQDLAGKQDKLSTTTDLHITDDSIIGLTDMAKKRLFIDMWNSACGSYGQYNADTGFFELNGLIDITYDEAIPIYLRKMGPSYDYRFLFYNTKVRTNLMQSDTPLVGINFNDCFNASSVEVIRLPDKTGVGSVFGMLSNTNKLKKIIGRLRIDQMTGSRDFGGTQSPLEEIWLMWLSKPLDISAYPKIKSECIKFLVENSNNGNTSVDVYIHQDIYEKLTDSSNTEWNEILQIAIQRNISFLTK